MPGCYQCTTVTPSGVDAIGVCQLCNCLGCPPHGGLPRGQPRFLCSRCQPGLMTQSAGGGGGSSGGGGSAGSSGGGTPGGGSGGGAAGGGPAGGASGDDSDGNEIAGGQAAGGAAASAGGAGVVQPSGQLFAGSLDWEMQMPEAAEASRRYRYEVDPRALRYSLRRLFALRDDEHERQALVGHIEQEVRSPLLEEVARQMRDRPAADFYFEAHGGLERITADRVAEVAGYYASWLDGGLEPWMASVYPVVDEGAWLGEADDEAGVIDLLLLADAVGLNAYSWGLEIGASPFRRLDIVMRMDVPMVVLTHLYALSAPISAGA